MEVSFDTINLEYVETRKVSILVKLVAMVLVVIFTFVPMYEFITHFAPVIDYSVWCCLIPCYY